MSQELPRRAIFATALGLGLGWLSGPASAVMVTPKFSFLDFYACGLYASTPPDNVDCFVNDSVATSQLCA
jgi:hypothetical protein